VYLPSKVATSSCNLVIFPSAVVILPSAVPTLVVNASKSESNAFLAKSALIAAIAASTVSLTAAASAVALTPANSVEIPSTVPDNVVTRPSTAAASLTPCCANVLTPSISV
jgi:hypothetical protein